MPRKLHFGGHQIDVLETLEARFTDSPVVSTQPDPRFSPVSTKLPTRGSISTWTATVLRRAGGRVPGQCSRFFVAAGVS
jgi:hypothetical protein